jgi:hypothetical protein
MNSRAYNFRVSVGNNEDFNLFGALGLDLADATLSSQAFLEYPGVSRGCQTFHETPGDLFR